METTVTTGKNNLGHPGATAPGFKSAARLRGEKNEVVFTSCHRCFHLIFTRMNILASIAGGRLTTNN